MANYGLSGKISLSRAGSEAPPANAVRNRVDNWMARHNPQLQGEQDAKLEGFEDDICCVDLFEKRITESFEKEIRLIDQEFTEKESSLYEAFQSKFSQWRLHATEAQPGEPAAAEAENSHPAIQDPPQQADEGVRLHPALRFLMFAVALVALTIMNVFVLAPLEDMGPLRVFMGIVLSLVMLTTGYFTGKFLRTPKKYRRPLVAMALPIIFMLGIFILILNHFNFDLKASATILVALMIFALVILLAYLPDDARPLLPERHPSPKREMKSSAREKDICDGLTTEIGDLAARRANNLLYYTKLQAVLVEAAQELLCIYRLNLQKNKPDAKLPGLAQRPLPNFAVIDLQLQDASGMSRVLNHLKIIAGGL